MSSLKSPSITGVLHNETCVNNLDSNDINVVCSMLGDLYTTAIYILPILDKCNVVETASMPLLTNI